MPTALASFYAQSSIPKRTRYEKLRLSMESIRKGGGFDSHWREIGQFIFPRRYRSTPSERNRPNHRHEQYIVESTARFALRTFQSGVHAGLTSPSRPWFALSTPDPRLAQRPNVKAWLYDVSTILRAIFASTNLYNALPVVYGDWGGFGTAAMSMLEDERDLFRCYTYPIGSYSIGLDRRGVASTFAHEYELSVRQVVEEFGVVDGYRDIDWSGISDRVKTAWDRGDYEDPVEICWLVKPNDEYRSDSPFAKHAKFMSCHYEKASAKVDSGLEHKLLKESGFNEFPIMAPRWEVTGNDAYGTDCPGMTALGDVRELQSMKREKGKLLAKVVAPPLKGPSVLRTQKVSSLPSDITYVDTREGQGGLEPVYEPPLEGYQHISADIADVRFLIRRAFYEDLFLMLGVSDPERGAQPMTAREVAERHEEKLIALGPALERNFDELLNPIIDRSYAMAERLGFIPDVPDELDGVKLKVEYTSILAQAQKLVAVSSLDRFVASIVPIVEIDPSARHKFNGQQAVDTYAEALSIDPRIIRSDEEAEEMARQEAEQQKGLAAAQVAKDTAGAVAAAGASPVAPDSALDRVMSGLRG